MALINASARIERLVVSVAGDTLDSRSILPAVHHRLSVVHWRGFIFCLVLALQRCQPPRPDVISVFKERCFKCADDYILLLVSLTPTNGSPRALMGVRPMYRSGFGV